MYVDPPRVHALAGRTRGHAEDIGAQSPVAGGVIADQGAGESEIARVLRDSAKTIDTVLSYHAQRLNHFADLADKGAREYVRTDAAGAHRLVQPGTAPG
ncbi:hypothetical protein VZC37_08850 [Gordonia sp. LSe1-13]|uniref:Uncharacterized protein n=1 Tax=Gordonia sesuvii TaxID=3116777 RepID=A0ABU7MBF9_9ACTN|nr:hypothetical protein [Gordonia sp. LSe1-13]